MTIFRLLVLVVFASSSALATESVSLSNRSINFHNKSVGTKTEAILQVEKIKTDDVGHIFVHPMIVTDSQKFYLRRNTKSPNIFDFFCTAYDSNFPVATDWTTYGMLEALFWAIPTDQIVGEVSSDHQVLDLYTLSTPTELAVKSFQCGTYGEFD